jgi:hypothetical protein
VNGNAEMCSRQGLEMCSICGGQYAKQSVEMQRRVAGREWKDV